jgi:hypothetical protein
MIYEQTSHAVSFDSIRHFILGQYSPKFQKYPAAHGSEEFYRSFTLFYGSGNDSLDVMAENEADFEALLIGLSALLHVEPRFGYGIDVSSEPGFFELDLDEVELCQSYHMSPYYYNEACGIIMQEQRRRGYVTIYDVRVATGLDILRCIKIHQILFSKNRIRSKPIVAE